MSRHAATAQLLKDAVAGAISGGAHTTDLGGRASASDFSKAVIAAMRAADLAA